MEVEPITRFKVAKWATATVIVLLMPGLLASFLSQLSSFLGIAVRGPIPDVEAILEDLYDFSRQLGFLLVVGGSLGIVLAFKAEDIPRIDSVAWYVHLVQHELVHALLAKACGYRIKELKFTRHGGYVAYSKPNSRGNFLISLGPYLFPLIPILLTLVAAVFRGTVQGVVVFLLGMAVGSHVAGTAREAMDQFDVRQVGRFFSLMLIMLANVCLIVLIMSVVAPSKVSFLSFIRVAGRLDTLYLSSLLGLITRLF